MDPVFPGFAVENDHFQRAQGAAGVPVAEAGDGVQGLFADRDVVPAETALIGEGPAEQGQDILPAEGLEHKDLAAGQKRAVDLKGGVFGGRADEHDAAFLHKGKEGILLGFVETVDFVHKDDRPCAVDTVFFRLLHDLADFLDAAGDGGEIDERGLGPQGDDPGNCGFADAGRTPEDHGGNDVRLDQAAQYLARTQQMLLAGDFIQRGRTHPGSQRLAGRIRRFFRQQGGFVHGRRLRYQVSSILYDIRKRKKSEQRNRQRSGRKGGQ